MSWRTALGVALLVFAVLSGWALLTLPPASRAVVSPPAPAYEDALAALAPVAQFEERRRGSRVRHGVRHVRLSPPPPRRR